MDQTRKKKDSHASYHQVVATGIPSEAKIRKDTTPTTKALLDPGPAKN
jgi:hypothetical protein